MLRIQLTDITEKNRISVMLRRVLAAGTAISLCLGMGHAVCADSLGGLIEEESETLEIYGDRVPADGIPAEEPAVDPERRPEWKYPLSGIFTTFPFDFYADHAVQTVTETECGIIAETESETILETESEIEPDSEAYAAETEAETEAGTETEAETESAEETEAETESETEEEKEADSSSAGVSLSSLLTVISDGAAHPVRTIRQAIRGTNAYFKEIGGGWQDQEDTTWSIRVNLTTDTVTVFRGQVPVKAFACSSGLNEGSTPLGNFQLKDKLRWHELVGPSWGQWCSHITYDILFHSLPYYSNCDKFSLDPYDYNQMGKPASHGCIRLTAANAKYIFDHCPVGTGVTIFMGTEADDPLGKPMPLFVGEWTGRYDPTDITIAQEGCTSDTLWEAWSTPMKAVWNELIK